MTSRISLTKENALEKNYKVALSPENIKQLIRAYLENKSVSGKAPAGFRPGKVPLSILYEQHRQEAIDHAVRTSIVSLSKDLAEDKKLAEPIFYKLHTSLEKMSFEEMNDYADDVVVHAHVSFMPDLPEVPWSHFSLTEYVPSPSSEEIDRMTEEHAQKMMTSIPLEEKRKAQKGDTLLYKMTYLAPDGTQKDTEGAFQLGSGMLPKEFEDTLEGIEEGHVFSERLRVPKDFPEKSLAGQKVSFKIIVTEIRQTVPHQANEDFAKTQGFHTLIEYKEKVKEGLTRWAEGLAHDFERQQLIHRLRAELNFDVPEQMVENEWHALWHDSALYKASDQEREDILKNISEENYKKELREAALFRVRFNFILRKIIEENKLSVEDKEFMAFIQSLAEEKQQPVEHVISFFRHNPHSAQAVIDRILRKKALDWACAQCAHQSIPVSLDEMKAHIAQWNYESPDTLQSEFREKIDLSGDGE